jgi:hypothetical protein
LRVSLARNAAIASLIYHRRADAHQCGVACPAMRRDPHDIADVQRRMDIARPVLPQEVGVAKHLLSRAAMPSAVASWACCRT